MKIEWPPVSSVMGQHTLHFESSTELPSQLEKKAFQELRETPQLKEASLDELRRLIKERGEVKMVLDDDIFLLSFLRVCKHYPESAYQRILAFYKLQNRYPKWFSDLQPINNGLAIKTNILTVLPYRDQEGRRILLAQVGTNWDVKEVGLDDIIRGALILVMAAAIETKTQVAGGVLILDLQGLNLSHIWQFSPSVAKALLIYAQECIPCRLKAVHIVNQPYVFNMLFSIFKPFINEKLRNRLFFHGSNMNGLCTVIDPKVLPTIYGGEMTFDNIYGEELHSMLLKYQHMYKLSAQNHYLAKNNRNGKIS